MAENGKTSFSEQLDRMRHSMKRVLCGFAGIPGGDECASGRGELSGPERGGNLQRNGGGPFPAGAGM